MREFKLGLCKMEDDYLTPAFKTHTIKAPDIDEAVYQAITWAQEVEESSKAWLQILYRGESIVSLPPAVHTRFTREADAAHQLEKTPTAEA